VFRGGRVPVVLAVASALLALGAGSAFAAYRYDLATSSLILPGVTVAGIDVGGMTRDEAVRAVAEEADLSLSSELVVRAAGETWTTTPAALGMRADVEGAVDRALALGDSMSFLSRVYHRVTDRPIDRSIDLGYAYDRATVESFVERAARAVAVPAVDAAINLVHDERLILRHAQEGLALKEGLARSRILSALRQRAASVTLPVRPVEPAVTDKTLGYTIVIKLSENTLYLYRGLKVEKTYPVATAAPGYTTPVGTWSIVNKVENPTWYNPAPDGWGAGEPLVIPPGPGNPLGTRAMYLDAPGIRIHGTYSSSSIGTYASHGCVRMYISDAEELYSIVPVGTKVIILW